MNSYWGGAVTAIGGALVIGAWVRIVRAKQWRYAWVFGIGAVVVILARPFEGFLLVVPALTALGMADRTARVWLPIVITGVLGASWLAYDNYRVTGHPLRLPYRSITSNTKLSLLFRFCRFLPLRERFGISILESRNRETYEPARSWYLFIDRPLDWLTLLRYYYGNLIWLLPVVVFLPALWHSRRTRFALILTAVIGAASLIEVWWYPHYGAPFLAALLILVAQSMRHLGQWKYHGRPVGRFLVNAMPVAVFAMMITSEAEATAKHRTADQIQAMNAQNAQKENIEQELLKKQPGQHVIFVSYEGLPSPHEEWIYNPANIDAAPVIWALDLGQTENEKLRNYYAGRSCWRFRPAESMTLSPY